MDVLTNLHTTVGILAALRARGPVRTDLSRGGSTALRRPFPTGLPRAVGERGRSATAFVVSLDKLEGVLIGLDAPAWIMAIAMAIAIAIGVIMVAIAIPLTASATMAAVGPVAVVALVGTGVPAPIAAAAVQDCRRHWLRRWHRVPPGTR